MLLDQFRKVFVSHANPEDNVFATWLSSRLSLLGYEVWCDLIDLKGGELFWSEIQKTIRDEAAKFLFVISEDSIKKDGTLRELRYADNVSGRNNFVIPLRVKDVPFGLEMPIEISGMNIIDFTKNWATGFLQLTEVLERDGVAVNSTEMPSDIANQWRSGLGIQDDIVADRDERYRSNWFQFDLPTQIYLHELSQKSVSNHIPFPLIRQDSNDGKFTILCFACSRCLSQYLSIAHTEPIDVDSFTEENEYVETVTNTHIKNTRNNLNELLNTALSNFLIQKGLRLYSFSNGDAYFFPGKVNEAMRDMKVDLTKYGRRFTTLIGTRREYRWHYAIQGSAFTSPYTAYWISSHVVFTKDGEIVPANKQHRLRRSRLNWYNKEWRDHLLGAMLWLSPEDKESEYIEVPLCRHRILSVKNSPVDFTSHVGYYEPGEKH